MPDAFIAVKNEDKEAVLPVLLQCDHAMREYRTHSTTHTVFYTSAERVQDLADPRATVFADRYALDQLVEQNGN